MVKRYLILGTGIAGFSAAMEIRRLDPAGEITMVGAEGEYPYLRPLLSKTDLRTLQRDKITLASEEQYRQNRITILRGAVVEQLRPAEHSVTLADGRSLHYDKCIYALGAAGFVPPIPGREKHGVLTLRTTEDLHALRRRCMTARTAVVIGGGVIGMEIAWELHQLGIACTILEAAPRLMARQLDDGSAQRLKERISDLGIVCETGVQIRELTGEAAVNGVLLADGRWFPGELVLLSTGVRPVIAPAVGLACDGGIRVEDTMVTADPDILAAGDCIQCSVPNPGLWRYALKTGEIAGHNAVFPDCPVKFSGEEYPLTLSAMGLGLFVMGDTSEGEGITTEVTLTTQRDDGFRVNHNSTGAQTYQKCFYRAGRLCGVVLMGDLREMAYFMKEPGGLANDGKQ